MYDISPKKCAYEPDDLRPWHHQIVDFYLQNPGATQEQCAEHLQKSQNWVSRIMGSTAFRKYYADRRQKLDELIGETTTGRLEQLTQKAIELLSTHLESSEVEPAFVLEVFDKGLSKLGYGTKTPLVVNNNVNNSKHLHVGLGEILDRIEGNGAGMKVINGDTE